jgi:hypothetical protein
MNVMSWKKEIERLIARDYLHQFIKKETKLEQDKKKNCTLDELPGIR